MKMELENINVMNASGRMINPFALKAEDHDPRIVAQTLSRICRFWGQTEEFYSVAQHCLIMAELFDEPELKRWSLIHEWFEGLTGMDIPSPIKHSSVMVEYREAEIRCLHQAAEIFGLTPPMPEAVKVADKRLMVTEALQMMNSENFSWSSIATPYPELKIEPMDMDDAEEAFIEKWNELFPDFKCQKSGKRVFGFNFKPFGAFSFGIECIKK